MGGYSVAKRTDVGEDVFEAEPQTAVKMSGEEFYSVHNDTDSEAQPLIFSTRLSEEERRTERREDFWPD